MRSTRRGSARALAALAAYVVLALAASAQGAWAHVLPPGSEAFGKTYGAWSAAWWQYVEGQPHASSPLSDTTGAGCRTAQSGQVFFLVGGSGNTSVTRDRCTVPAGKALFFPLVNALDFEPGFTPLQVWDELEGAFGPITALHASIDGKAVGDLDPQSTPYRVCAGPVARCSAPSFSITLPAENAYGVPAGPYDPAVDDGVYLLVTPLALGAHTINFGGTATFLGSEFSEEVTYHLVVTPS